MNTVDCTLCDRPFERPAGKGKKTNKCADCRPTGPVVRIPGGVAKEVDEVRAVIGAHFGAPEAAVSFAWVHHMALRTGLKTMKVRLRAELEAAQCPVDGAEVT